MVINKMAVKCLNPYLLLIYSSESVNTSQFSRVSLFQTLQQGRIDRCAFQIKVLKHQVGNILYMEKNKPDVEFFLIVNCNKFKTQI